MVTILDYGAGNLTSVRLAFERLGAETRTVAEAGAWDGAGRLVFPGVGSARSGMEGVRARGFDVLLRQAAAKGVPILGICLGMQLLMEGSEEDGGVAGLGLIPGRCVRFDPARDPAAKIPHMGWNTVSQGRSPHPLFAGVAEGEAFYFVHSYHAAETPAAAGWTDYCGVRFPSVVAAGPLFATQFHPERSGQAGAALLRNFLAWEPKEPAPCC